MSMKITTRKISSFLLAVIVATASLMSIDAARMQPIKTMPEGPNFPTRGAGNIPITGSMNLPASYVAPVTMTIYTVAQTAKKRCGRGADNPCVQFLEKNHPAELKEIGNTIKQHGGGKKVSFVPLCRSLITLLTEGLETYCESLEKSPTIKGALSFSGGGRSVHAQKTDGYWAGQLFHYIKRWTQNQTAHALCTAHVRVLRPYSSEQFIRALEQFCEQLKPPAASWGSNPNSTPQKRNPAHTQQAYNRQKENSTKVLEKLRKNDRVAYDALIEYTGAGASKMNFCMRGGAACSENDQKTIQAISQALSQSTIENMVLYRGGGYSLIGKEEEQKIKRGEITHLVGKRIQDRAFMSTTSNDKLTQARGMRIPLHDVLLVIDVPAGTEGLVLEPISSIPSEKEVLLQRNTTLEVTHVEKLSSGTFVAYTKVIPKQKLPRSTP